MRTGYAIRDRHQQGWLQTRTQLDGVSCPVTVWAENEESAMVFHRLKDAKAMLKVVRRDHRRPDKVHIVDPKWKVIV